MAFGFPAYFTETRSFHLAQDELFAVVKSAFVNSGWLGFEILNNNEFHKRLHNSPLTWGEEFTVVILPGGVIEAKSRCVSGMGLPQVVDFGVNKQNVKAFFASVEHCIEQKAHLKSAAEIERESVEREKQIAAEKPRAATSRNGCVGCFFAAIVFIILLWFAIHVVSAVIGLFTGHLYLMPARGSREITIDGIWARIISGLILAAAAWLIVIMIKGGKKRR